MMKAVVGDIQALFDAGALSGLPDGLLLDRFINRREPAVFGEIVRRHGPMVWRTCRRLLHSHQDAEDAFQATFLVLVRRAPDVPDQAVAGWLYGVARRTALKARAAATKRGRREIQVETMPEPEVPDARDGDLLAVLDEELGRLPGLYQAVVVLCDLEGLTRREAAGRLGIPEGSVASRLARARALLAKRLARRGVVCSIGSVAAALSARSAPASAPLALVASTITAAHLLAAGQAAGIISAEVSTLTQGVVKTMSVAKLKLATAVLLAALVVGAAAFRRERTLVKGGGAPVAAKEDALGAMLKRLQGTWKCVSVHANGEKSETVAVLTVKGNKWEYNVKGKKAETGIYHLIDLDVNPKQIDSIEETDVPGRDDKTLNGIFMLDGDSLIMCFGALGRPESFFTRRGDGCISMQFMRDRAE